MKLWQYVAGIVAGVSCVALSLATVLMAKSSATLHESIQVRQQKLNSGILGPQGQQVAGNVIQEMAAVAVTNRMMMGILVKHGYNMPNMAAQPAEPENQDVRTTKGKDDRSKARP